MIQTAAPDGFDARFALGAAGAVEAFNRAGIITTSDVHVALRLVGLAGTSDDVVTLGVAFAARAPRLGHVCVDLGQIHATASADTDAPVEMGSLPWPDPSDWVARVAASPLVGRDRPLQLEGSVLYLDRLWTDERQVASDLLRRAERTADGIVMPVLAAGLSELFASQDDPDLQRMAAASAVLRRLSVVAGGPGTGKTTTVAGPCAPRSAGGGERGTTATRRSRRADREGGGAAGRGRARRCEGVADRPDDSHSPWRTRRIDDPPPARLQSRKPDSFSSSPAEPAPPRRGRCRRDVDGAPDADGATRGIDP